MNISEAVSWAMQNQFLVGGVGTIAVGGLAYVARSVPNTIFSIVKRAFTTNFVITTRYHQYDDVSSMLNRYSIPFLMRNFAPNIASDSQFSKMTGSKKKSNITSGYGKGWGYYKGVVFVTSRSMLENQTSVDGIQEQISIQFFTRNVDIVSQFMDEASQQGHEDFIKISISDESHFYGSGYKRKRNVDSIFIQKEKKDAVINKMGWFIDNEQWFSDRGIPYKFCAILYGEPGTGKTSLIHAVASRYNLDLNYVTDISSIDSLIAHRKPNDLLIIEDIDALCQGLDRKESEKSGKSGIDSALDRKDRMSLHKLLNAIDGFCTPHGLKVMMTTNHLDRLDPAILRPGRTDFLMEVGLLEGQDVIDMYSRFYSPEEAALINVDAVVPRSGSSLQGIMMEYDAVTARRMITNHE